MFIVESATTVRKAKSVTTWIQFYIIIIIIIITILFLLLLLLLLLLLSSCMNWSRFLPGPHHKICKKTWFLTHRSSITTKRSIFIPP